MRTLTLFIFAALGMSAAQIVSGDGTGEFNSSLNPTNRTAAVDPAWQPNTHGAKWVTPQTTPNNGETISYYEQFLSLPGTMFLSVWADDTVVVYLDGERLNTANTTLGTHCVDGPGGCTEENVLELTINLTGGLHTLRFDVTQLGGGPSGVMYYADIVAAPVGYEPVPEPTTTAMAGVGLALVLANKFRKPNSKEK